METNPYQKPQNTTDSEKNPNTKTRKTYGQDQHHSDENKRRGHEGPGRRAEVQRVAEGNEGIHEAKREQGRENGGR